ncbi:hypothetical protein LP420_05470 [Massilia sp. B-10]|nr:hypothetical protein LP420_05470 [Massilia sp. B-10]
MGFGQAARLVALEGGARRQQGRLALGGCALGRHQLQLLFQLLDEKFFLHDPCCTRND